MTVAAGLLLAATSNVWALPPRQHAVSGVIKAIDYDAHTITLAPAKGDNLALCGRTPLVFRKAGAGFVLARWNPARA